MEAFILSWAFPVLILIIITCITFLLVKKYMDKKRANIVFAISLFLSVAIGLCIQSNRFIFIDHVYTSTVESEYGFIVYDKLTGTPHYILEKNDIY